MNMAPDTHTPVTTMKAIGRDRYCEADQVTLREAPAPTPAADEIRVRVKATSMNFGDQALMRGRPWLIRLMSGVLKPKTPLLGLDFAGHVDAVGSGVTRFQPGDAVFGEATSGALGHVQGKSVVRIW